MFPSSFYSYIHSILKDELLTHFSDCHNGGWECGQSGREAIKQVASIRRLAAKVPEGTVMHSSTGIPTCTPPAAGREVGGGEGGGHSRGKDGGCHPTVIPSTLSRC